MDGKIVIREYEPADKEAVMELLRLNTPRYFAPEEAADLDAYLERERELYYVLLHEERIVGCGGINFADGGTVGKISWDMVHPQYRGKSLGTRLLRHRIEKLEAMRSVRRITVRTSQLAFGFYEKRGFELKGIEKDYWAAWNMSVGNKSRRRQALQPVGYGVLRRNGCGAQGFRRCRFGAEDAGKERVLRRVS